MVWEDGGGDPASYPIKREIMNMAKYLFIGIIALTAVGILLISFVQTRIINQHGIRRFRERGFINVYWHDRTTTERWCFYIGLFLSIIPFIAIGLIAVLNV